MTADIIGRRPPHGRARSRGRRGPKIIVTTGLLVLTLVLAACGTTSGGSGGSTPGPSPTASPPTSVKVYFAHHPETDEHPDQVFAVTRNIPHDIAQPLDLAAYALRLMLAGPTTAEQAEGYYSPFSGALALISNCPGPFRDFDLTYDQRGVTAEPGTVTMRFCRRVDIAGDLDGPRMLSMITQTLLQFPAIHRVVVLTWTGECFNDLAGNNACLGGAPAGYPVQVYFSHHPDSDSRPAAVFAVNRTSPTLGVASFAIAQLLAGPLPSEASQGYFTPLAGALSGPSTCSDADFSLKLDWNRTHAETGTATLQFCRTVRGLGDTGTAMAHNEIASTLTQFPNIKKVVILTADGSCFDDLVGCQ
jgi:hypothetical protein